MKRWRRRIERSVAGPYPKASLHRRWSWREVSAAASARELTFHECSDSAVRTWLITGSCRKLELAQLRTALSRMETCSWSSEFSKRFNSIRSVRASVTSLRSARESRSSDAEVRNIGDADPGRNRTPTERVPGGRVNDHAAVSGPQTRMPTPRIHSTSMQASGTRRCSPSAHAVQPHTRMSERSGATDCGVYQPMTRAYRAAPTRRRLQSTGPKRYPNPLMVLMYFGFAGSDSSLDRRLRMVASTTRVLSWSEPHTFRIR